MDKHAVACFFKMYCLVVFVAALCVSVPLNHQIATVGWMSPSAARDGVAESVLCETLSDFKSLSEHLCDENGNLLPELIAPLMPKWTVPLFNSDTW